jgi:hypothetical protein
MQNSNKPKPRSPPTYKPQPKVELKTDPVAASPKPKLIELKNRVTDLVLFRQIDGIWYERPAPSSFMYMRNTPTGPKKFTPEWFYVYNSAEYQQKKQQILALVDAAKMV